MKAIIFDMDGVLVDSMPYHAEAWKQAFATAGISIEHRDIYELEGSNHRQIVELIFKRFGRTPNVDDMEELSRKKIEIFNEIEHVKPFEGIKELVAKLASKYRLAVVSGSNRRTVHDLMNTFFPDTFQVIIDGDDVSKSKPSPEPYQKAVEKLGVPKEKCLVIENAPLGIRSAKSAGLRCIAIPTYLEKESVKEADVIAESHRDLERIISEEERAQQQYEIMELKFKGNEIKISKELSMLDNLVLDFVNIFAKHNIKNVIVSGYVAILFGLNRMSEDVDILIHNITFEKFLKLWLELEKNYDCLDTSDPIDAYNGYLRYHHAIRIVKKDNFVPNFHIRFVKNEIDRLSLKYRKPVNLDGKILFISPPEIQIPYKLFQGSDKDIEDARFLFKLFTDELNVALMDRFLAELEIPKESIDKYLGRA